MVHREPCEDRNRNWGDASISHGMPKMISKPPELGERHGIDFLFTAVRRN